MTKITIYFFIIIYNTNIYVLMYSNVYNTLLPTHVCLWIYTENNMKLINMNMIILPNYSIKIYYYSDIYSSFYNTWTSKILQWSQQKKKRLKFVYLWVEHIKINIHIMSLLRHTIIWINIY